VKENFYEFPKYYAYMFIFVLALLSAIYDAHIPLHGDEAYYWMWSYRLQGGYYDHPPLIAFMIYLTDFISQHEWGVRLVTIFSMSVAAIYTFKLTSLLFNEKIAFNAVVILLSTLLVQAGFTIVTPDAPLTLFWSMGLYYAYRAITFEKTADFIISGIVLGLMMLAKYTAILFVPILLLFILLKKPRIFMDIRFYITILIVLIIISPLLWWNYEHDWISFLFQLHHGQKASWNFHRFFEYFGGQFAIYTPLFFGYLLYILLRKKELYTKYKLLYLTIATLVPLLFFLYKSLSAKMELNYTAPAFITATILIAYMIDKYDMKKVFKYGLIVAITLSLIVRVALLYFLPIVQDRMYGNKEAIKLLSHYRKQSDAIYANHLTIAALEKFYLQDHPRTQIPTHSRFSQYDMYKTEAEKNGNFKNGLYLSLDKKDAELHKVFHTVTLLDTLSVKKRNGIKTFYIYRVAN